MERHIATAPLGVITSVLISTALFTVGCSANVREVSHAPDAAPPPLPASQGIIALEGSTPGPVDAERHHVGDAALHRFSGTYRNHPLMLREEVVSASRDTFTVLYTLDEGATQEQLLVTRAQRSERILSVERRAGEDFVSGSLLDYEAMIKKTLFTPDINHGQIAKKSQTCLVDRAEHDCDIAEYRVQVADQEARMSVARSRALGRDVSGEIVAIDGTLLYHAELLEEKHSHAAAEPHNSEVAVISPLW